MSLNQDWMDRLPATHASIHTPVHDSPGRGVTDLRRRRREESAEHVVKAAQFLRGQGFPKVVSLAGGIDRWSLEVDSSVPRY